MVSVAGVTEATPSALTGGSTFTVAWNSSGTTGATAPVTSPAVNSTTKSGSHW
jgi:hypothetical protein